MPRLILRALTAPAAPDAGEGRRLKLSGIGRIAVRWHRKLEATIKTARVFCRAGKWFVAFSCEVEKPEPLPKTGESIGVACAVAGTAAGWFSDSNA